MIIKKLNLFLLLIFLKNADKFYLYIFILIILYIFYLLFLYYIKYIIKYLSEYNRINKKILYIKTKNFIKIIIFKKNKKIKK
jgi:hypothetical protein